jgi:phosphoribosyl 1,2-cyclic phosphodiesterase
VKVTLWGTRGSLPTPGPETTRYGGNTSCVTAQGDDGTIVILDAGTGIRRLGRDWPAEIRRADILLSHLHMDHIQGLGFFAPLLDPDMEVHIWGPQCATDSLTNRLGRYLSPPLFPVLLRKLPCQLTLHEISDTEFEIGPFRITSDKVIHPGPTLGYRVENGRGSMAYMPDHEPALGVLDFPQSADWTSGHRLASGVDLLIHDAQYSAADYLEHVGWGHSTIPQAMALAHQAGAGHLVLFHHDPMHTDVDIDRLAAEAARTAPDGLVVTAAREGEVFDLDAHAPRQSPLFASSGRVPGVSGR